jgi:hypothetical protein
VDELEMRLKSLPLRESSVNLEAGVLSQKPEPCEMHDAWRISVRWAAAASLLMGAIGFYFGIHWQTTHAIAKSIPQNTTYIYIVPDPDSSKRWFDLTSEKNVPTNNQWKITIKDAKGKHDEKSL